jgi:hypothetical protein
MDYLFEAIGQLLSNFKDPVQIVLLLVCFAEGFFLYWLVKVLRAEDREDKEKIVEALNNNTEALNGVKNVLSAMTGKPV